MILPNNLLPNILSDIILLTAIAYIDSREISVVWPSNPEWWVWIPFESYHSTTDFHYDSILIISWSYCYGLIFGLAILAYTANVLWLAGDTSLCYGIALTKGITIGSCSKIATAEIIFCSLVHCVCGCFSLKLGSADMWSNLHPVVYCHHVNACLAMKPRRKFTGRMKLSCYWTCLPLKTALCIMSDLRKLSWSLNLAFEALQCCNV